MSHREKTFFFVVVAAGGGEGSDYVYAQFVFHTKERESGGEGGGN
jgi:hypothetical protein